MYLLKLNELAKEFYDTNGLGILSNMLQKECI
jgi:hypothetical protein